MISKGPTDTRAVSCQYDDTSKNKLQQAKLPVVVFPPSPALVNTDCSPCRLVLVPAVVYLPRFLSAVRKKKCISLIFSHQAHQLATESGEVFIFQCLNHHQLIITLDIVNKIVVHGKWCIYMNILGRYQGSNQGQ